MIERPDIYKEFYDLLAQIPEGYVSTYGDLALQLGDIMASRAVGEMLSENDQPDVLPCYRVVMSDGTIGGYTHPLGVAEKIRRLRRDGISVVNGKIENFEKVRYRDFRSTFPLKRYNEQVGKMDIEESGIDAQLLRAIDVAYLGRVGVGIGADIGTEIRYEVTVKKVKAPYIPNYLYLREGEIVESLLSRERLNVIDGNGLLHPLRRGIATVAGANTGRPTVGVAKSLLLGRVVGEDVLLDGIPVGKMIGRYVVSYGYGIPLRRAISLLKDQGSFPQTLVPDKLAKRYRDLVLPAEDSLR
ncbi:MAG: endonuclease V [Thermoplasmata archaeon]